MADFGEDPAAKLAEWSAKENVDVLVMGTHGLGSKDAPKSGKLGSVSQRCMTLVHCSVLISK